MPSFNSALANLAGRTWKQFNVLLPHLPLPMEYTEQSLAIDATHAPFWPHDF